MYFNLTTLIKLINTNDDDIIQKKEVQEFKDTQQAPSIFSEYFDSVNSDTNYNAFLKDLTEIYQAANEEPNMQFKDKNVQQRFESDSIAQTREDNYNEFYWKFETEEQYNKVFDYLIKDGKTNSDIQQKLKTMKPTISIDEMLQKSPIADYKIECDAVSWKFENEDTYNKAFKGIVMQAVYGDIELEDIPKAIKSLNIQRKITMDDLRENNLYDIKIHSEEAFDDIDWSDSREIFNYLCYTENTFANTPQEHLPAGYNPQEVFEKGKTVGLGMDEVHQMGYTGEGVNVAVIDSFINQHDDVQLAEYNESPYAAEGTVPHFHGVATAGIIGGKKTGIAPNSSIHYFGENEGGNADRKASMIDDLSRILEYNKQNPDNKIRIVSISSFVYGGEKAQELVRQLEEQGVWVLSSGDDGEDCDAKKFGYLEKKDPMGSPDDFDNYQIANANDSAKYGNLYINSGNLTVPSDTSSNGYRHDPRACQSWAIPVMAGYYTLACQADPSMTKEKFMELAEKTAQVKDSTEPIPDKSHDNAPPLGRTEDTIQIKIIDIKALLEEIERTKEN